MGTLAENGLINYYIGKGQGKMSVDILQNIKNQTSNINAK